MYVLEFIPLSNYEAHGLAYRFSGSVKSAKQ